MTHFSKDSWKKKLAFFLLYQNGIGRRTVSAILDSLPNNQIKPDLIREHIVAHTTIKSNIKNILLSHNLDTIESFYYSKMKELMRDSVTVLFFYDSTYPETLKRMDDPPLFLFCKGNVAALRKQGVAIVGTRKVTAYGRSVTEKITREVVSDGFCTISGCMYGVDELVHQVTLREKGATIAVVGYGFKNIYPERMGLLLHQIVSNSGLVISEYFPEEKAQQAYFIARNRIIAGLSHSVVVTEAAQKSGSHSTALYAAASGRSVYAVPGPITNPYSEGTKWLVNQGATLLTSGFEIAEHRGESTRQEKGTKPGHQDREMQSLEDKIISSIRSGPTSIESLVSDTQESISCVLVALSALELQGRVVKDGILWYLR